MTLIPININNKTNVLPINGTKTNSVANFPGHTMKQIRQSCDMPAGNNLSKKTGLL